MKVAIKYDVGVFSLRRFRNLLALEKSLGASFEYTEGSGWIDREFRIVAERSTVAQLMANIERFALDLGKSTILP